MSDLLYKDITEKVIGCAMKVHSYFGIGFPEMIYKRAVMIELKKAGLSFKSEVERDINYDQQLIAKRRLDLIVEDKILVELKAISETTNKDFAQVINYLNVFQIEVGLLLNFGQPSLQYKRFVSSRNQRNRPN
jgi:GxxExxY protein